MAGLSTLSLIFFLVLACPLPSLEARKLLNMAKRHDNSPTETGHAMATNERLFAHHLAGIDDRVLESVPRHGNQLASINRVLESVPSPGVGHELASMPIPAVGNDMANSDEVLKSVPSPGVGHQLASIDRVLESVPSPGVGHKPAGIDRNLESVTSPGVGY